MSTLSIEEKKILGASLNLLKADTEGLFGRYAAKFEVRRQHLEPLAAVPALDVTLPGIRRQAGIPHPLIETMNRVVEVFHQLGYSTALGPAGGD